MWAGRLRQDRDEAKTEAKGTRPNTASQPTPKEVAAER